MFLILRGHIRDSFSNNDLFNFVHTLTRMHRGLKIFIHTWNIHSNGISWQTIRTNEKIVTEDVIKNYFRNLSKFIDTIIIEDDSKINLIGNTEGKINNGLMPLIGWKNYWYGKYSIISAIKQKYPHEKCAIINCRFDLFKNSNSELFNCQSVIHFISNNKKHIFTKNVFYKDEEFLGVDNIYIGNLNTMYTLVEYFHKYLDSILQNNTDTIHQEFLVYRMNNQIFK